MDIFEITDREIWDDFVISCDTDSFLHSWNWGEFNRQSGEHIWRLGLKQEEELRAVALVIKVEAKRGTFLFIPQGPVMALGADRAEVINVLRDHLVSLGRKEKAGFLRLSPLLTKSEDNLQLMHAAGFRDAPVHMMHPETTWILDIRPEAEELMKNMKKNHRNLIRRAAKDGVTIEMGDGEEELKSFYAIHLETVERHHFVPFSYDYIRTELETFRRDGQIMVFNARYQDRIISSAVVAFYGNEAFYHHGASSSDYARVPSSYLALWTAIEEAKRRGLAKFNFYGIVDDQPKHPWYGLSRFKKGFGGYETKLVHCQDLPLNRSYGLTWTVETLRKIKRGY